MIDLHSHILPGLDDGPTTMEGSIALARAAVAAGTSVMVATPHVDLVHGVEPELIRGAVETVNAALEREGIGLHVLRGGELSADRLPDLSESALGELALGGGPYLLLECPFTPQVALEPVVAELHDRGFSVVLAHPERCPGLRLDPGQLKRLVDGGALVSVTDGSLDGRFGKTVQRFARTMFLEGLVHNVTSDAHGATRRPPDLGTGLRRAERELRGLAAHRRYLTRSVPAAVVNGSPLPGRPRTPRRWPVPWR